MDGLHKTEGACMVAHSLHWKGVPFAADRDYTHHDAVQVGCYRNSRKVGAGRGGHVRGGTEPIDVDGEVVVEVVVVAVEAEVVEAHTDEVGCIRDCETLLMTTT